MSAEVSVKPGDEILEKEPESEVQKTPPEVVDSEDDEVGHVNYFHYVPRMAYSNRICESFLGWRQGGKFRLSGFGQNGNITNVIGS